MREFNVIFGDSFDRSDVDDWCRQMWRSLRDGGVWAIPRSGLIFRKQGDQLVLINRMPHMVEMPITAAQLIEQQESDFEVTKDRFGRVGVTVTKQTGV